MGQPILIERMISAVLELEGPEGDSAQLHYVSVKNPIRGGGNY